MAERNLPPTERRLREARERGEAAVSTDLNALGSLLGILAALWLGHEALAADMVALIELAVGAATSTPGQPASLDALWSPLLQLLARLALPIVGAGLFGTLLIGLLQTRGMLSLKAIAPKLERLSPAQLFKNLLSTRQLFTLAKVAVKVLLLGGALYLALAASLDALLRLAYLPAAGVPPVAHSLLLKFIGLAAMLYVPAAAMDYAHQRYEFIKRNRMSIEEMRHEHKDDEGDPYIKSHRKDTARELLEQGAVQALASASVVIANPTHVAVALRFVRGVTPLPLVVAKEVEAGALRLRREAERRGIPVVEDRRLARRLYASSRLNEPIGDDVLRPVAGVFRRLAVASSTPAHRGTGGVPRVQ